jgi:hypothetical protein
MCDLVKYDCPIAIRTSTFQLLTPPRRACLPKKRCLNRERRRMQPARNLEHQCLKGTVVYSPPSRYHSLQPAKTFSPRETARPQSGKVRPTDCNSSSTSTMSAANNKTYGIGEPKRRRSTRGSHPNRSQSDHLP